MHSEYEQLSLFPDETVDENAASQTRDDSTGIQNHRQPVTKMPVIFDARDAGLLQSWLDPSAMPPWDEERVLEKAVTDMVYEKRPWKGYKTAVQRAMAQGAL